MSRQRQARLERAAADLRRAQRSDEAAAIRAAIRDPGGAPSEHVATFAVRIRITSYMMVALDGFGEDQALELLARDGIQLSPLELDEARRSLRQHRTSLGIEAGAA